MSPRARVWAILIGSLLVSLAANVAAGQWSPGGVVASAAAPLALWAMLELARVLRGLGDGLGRFGWVAAVVVAGLAFVVSYRHQRDVALRFGQDEMAAHLLPIMVDFPIAVATLALAVLPRGSRSSGAAEDPQGASGTRVEVRQVPSPVAASHPTSNGRAPELEVARPRALAMPLDQARALLADVPRNDQGHVRSIAAAARALGVHHSTAKPILRELGLLSDGA